MKYAVWMIIILFLLVACDNGEKKNYVTVDDGNEDGCYTIPDGSVLGPTSVSYYPEYEEVTIRNYSGSDMGFDLRKDDVIYVAISFIAQGETETQRGIRLDPNLWLRATSIFYVPDLSSFWIQTIQLLGLDFINEIEDWMVDSQYQVVVRFLGVREQLKRIALDPELVARWQKNSENNNMEKQFLAHRKELESRGINVDELIMNLRAEKARHIR